MIDVTPLFQFMIALLAVCYGVVAILRLAVWLVSRTKKEDDSQ